jgi:hypothetical protein
MIVNSVNIPCGSLLTLHDCTPQADCPTCAPVRLEERFSERMGSYRRKQPSCVKQSVIRDRDLVRTPRRCAVLGPCPVSEPLECTSVLLSTASNSVVAAAQGLCLCALLPCAMSRVTVWSSGG